MLSPTPPLATHFMLQASKRLNVPALRLAQTQLRLLQQYGWPGNVRELQNVIERAVILARGGPLPLEAILRDFDTARTSAPSPRSAKGLPASVVSRHEWRRQERANLEAALSQAGGKIYGKGGAAELLGMKPTTLLSRIKALKISRRG